MKKSYKWLWIVVGIIVILLVIFVPTKQVAYTVEVPYDEKVPKTRTYEVESGEYWNSVSPSLIKFEIGGKREYEGQNRHYYELDYTACNLWNEKIRFNVVGECYDEDRIPITFFQPIQTSIYTLNAGDCTNRLLRSNTEYSPRTDISAMDWIELYNCKIIAQNVESIFTNYDKRTETYYETVQKTKTETRYKRVNWLFG